MRSAAIFVALLIPLCGCGDPARQALAQCKLAAPAEAKDTFGPHYAIGYIGLCMESKGFVEDGHLSEEDGKTCQPDIYSDEHASCFRRDDEISKMLVGLFAKGRN